MTDLPDHGASLSETQPVEGPSFGWPVRILASVLVLAMGSTGWSALSSSASSLGAPIRLAIGLGVVFVVMGYAHILISRTGLAEGRLYQTGLLGKQVAIDRITQVRIVHLRGLEWLIVPRLIVRSGALWSQSYPTADARVLGAFKVLAYGRSPAN